MSRLKPGMNPKKRISKKRRRDLKWFTEPYYEMWRAFIVEDLKTLNKEIRK